MSGGCFFDVTLDAALHKSRDYELSERGLQFDAQRAVPIVYKHITLASVYRLDLIVNDLIVVEVKSIDRPTSERR